MSFKEGHEGVAVKVTQPFKTPTILLLSLVQFLDQGGFALFGQRINVVVAGSTILEKNFNTKLTTKFTKMGYANTLSGMKLLCSKGCAHYDQVTFD
jgi:hypothetical protein